MINNCLSVIMSTFNSEAYVEHSVNSILNQSYKNFEFLIIDDASIDKTFNKLTEISKKDSRVKVYQNEKNIGLTKSLNKLIQMSKGEYIARQDDDDTSEHIRLECQIDFMKEKKVEVCTTRAKVLNSSKLIPGISFYIPNKIAINYKNPFIHGTLMIKKSLLDDIGGYDENFYYSQDYKLFKDLIRQNQKIKTINKPLYKLNIENNISSNHKKEQKYFANCVRKNLTP
tara:strand:- start:4194 stop:4877 length:684 start_codon:yes stop_codon:yes gene_type:complete